MHVEWSMATHINFDMHKYNLMDYNVSDYTIFIYYIQLIEINAE